LGAREHTPNSACMQCDSVLVVFCLSVTLCIMMMWQTESVWRPLSMAQWLDVPPWSRVW